MAQKRCKMFGALAVVLPAGNRTINVQLRVGVERDCKDAELRAATPFPP